MQNIDKKELEGSLLENITKKGIAIEVNLKHVDLNNQDEVDLITNIAESLNDEIECLKKLLENK